MSSNFNVTGYGGGAQKYNGQKINAWGVAIATGAAVFLIQAVIFQLLKGTNRFKRVYQPRTYLIPERQIFQPSPNNPIQWFLRIWKLEKEEIISKCGIDAWAFLRFLRMMLKCFIPLAILVPLVLFPINLVHGNYQNPIPGTGGQDFYNQTGLSILSFGNVNSQNPNLYWGHCIMAIVVIAWCCYVFFDEMVEFIKTRQAYLTSPEHRLKASASTVLVQNIPPEFQSQKALMDLFDVFPGGIRKIWLNRDFTQLAYNVSRRKDIVSELEDAITNLSRKANKRYREDLEKEAKKSASNKSRDKDLSKENNQQQTRPDDYQGDDSTTNLNDRNISGDRNPSMDSVTAGYTTNPSSPVNNAAKARDIKSVTRKSSPESFYVNEKYANDDDGNALWQKYLKKGDRDTIRILRFGWTFFTTWPAWTLVGLPITKSVDRIYYCRQELAKLNHQIEREQEDADQLLSVNSAFIQFNNQAAAHMCTQMLIHHAPALMTPRTVEISPVDVLWGNLSTKWWVKWIAQIIVLGIFVAMLFLWAVAFLVIGTCA